MTPSLLRNRDLWLATACASTVSMAAFGIIALSPQLRHAYGLSIAQVGLLLSVVFAAAAVVALPAGSMIDRVGASTAVAVGEAFAALGFLLAVASSSPVLLFAGMVAIGVGYGAVSPGTSALASLDIDDSRRGLAMGIRVMGQTTGGALGGLSLPLLASAVGWRATAVLPVMACLAVGALALRNGRRTMGASPLAATPARPLGRSPRQLMWAYGFAMSGLQIALFAYLPIYLVDEKGLSVTAASVGYFLAFALGSVGRLGWGALSDRIASRALPLSSVAVGSGVAFALLPVVPAVAVWPALALAGLSTASWNAVYHAAIVESAGADEIGRVLGRALLFLFLGGIGGPALLGLLVGELGWTSAWLIAAGATALLGGSLWWLGVRPERRPGVERRRRVGMAR